MYPLQDALAFTHFILHLQGRFVKPFCNIFFKTCKKNEIFCFALDKMQVQMYNTCKWAKEFISVQTCMRGNGSFCFLHFSERKNLI